MTVLFARCPTCNGIDTQPSPTGEPILFCPVCEALFPVDESAVKPDGFADAVRAVAQALFDDNLLWITVADNPAARAWGGPRDARHLAAEVATAAVFRVLAGQPAGHGPLAHLEECEPGEHPGWTKMPYSEALALGAAMCPQTQYMTNELFADEEVWVEHPAPRTGEA